MLQTYLNLINHNRYLKINYSNNYKYSRLNYIILNVKFNKDLNHKFIIICLFFLFKNILLKNGYFIVLNKNTKKIIGMKFMLHKNLMYNFINFILQNFLNQPEMQNNIKISSFDSANNYILNIDNSYYYYLEKFLVNPYFKTILSNFTMTIIFEFKHNFDLYDHIFYLNFLKFCFSNFK